MSKGIQRIFSEVSGTYEWINHVLTFCLDIVWRKRAARIAARSGGTRWIDMCTGTGETARYLRRYASEDPQIFAADFSLPMIREAVSHSRDENIHFVIADIQHLPFKDSRFDLITISFATRNINLGRRVLVECFREFYRVLTPEGRFINLETTQPSINLVKKGFHFYVKALVKPVGTLLSGSKSGYAYLSRTIPIFYSAEELADILQEAGFQNIRFERLFPGIAAIHQCRKS
jgi:demethylmenaquinone methyltransferase/2-methoxy-6-polyprenyl-1,4-benzoquinol methylase